MNPMAQVLENNQTLQMMMERTRWTLPWLLPMENGEEEALRVAEVEVLHQNVAGISFKLLFVQFSLLMFCVFVIFYVAVKSRLFDFCFPCAVSSLVIGRGFKTRTGFGKGMLG